MIDTGVTLTHARRCFLAGACASLGLRKGLRRPCSAALCNHYCDKLGSCFSTLPQVASQGHSSCDGAQYSTVGKTCSNVYAYTSCIVKGVQHARPMLQRLSCAKLQMMTRRQ